MSNLEVFGGDPSAPTLKPVEPVGANGVCLVMKTLHGEGLQITLSIENDSPETPKLIDPRDPAHVLAWFVQACATELIGVAAMRLQASLQVAAKQAVADAQGAANEPIGDAPPPQRTLAD